MMRRKRIAMLVMAWGLVLTVGGCSPVYFPDHALETAVRAELSKPFGLLWKRELLEVRKLDAIGLNIRDLSGLENCTNLAWLDLDNNQVTNINALKELGRPESPFDSPLVFLNLNGNSIVDIAPLAGLLNLQAVMLAGNTIADIRPLVVNAQNMGLGEGDYVVLDSANLSSQAIDVDIPELESFGVRIIGGPEDTGSAKGITTR